MHLFKSKFAKIDLIKSFYWAAKICFKLEAIYYNLKWSMYIWWIYWSMNWGKWKQLNSKSLARIYIPNCTHILPWPDSFHLQFCQSDMKVLSNLCSPILSCTSKIGTTTLLKACFYWTCFYWGHRLSYWIFNWLSINFSSRIRIAGHFSRSKKFHSLNIIELRGPILHQIF